MSNCLLVYIHSNCIIIHIYHVPTIHPHHLPRPPTLPPKPQRMRKSRPRSIFNRKLFNGNMEAFIQVSAHLCSLSLHELSCLASSPWGLSCLCPLFYPNVGSPMRWLSSCSLPCLRSLAIQEGQGEVKTNQTSSGGGLISQALHWCRVLFWLFFFLLWAPSP